MGTKKTVNEVLRSLKGKSPECRCRLFAESSEENGSDFVLLEGDRKFFMFMSDLFRAIAKNEKDGFDFEMSPEHGERPIFKDFSNIGLYFQLSENDYDFGAFLEEREKRKKQI